MGIQGCRVDLHVIQMFEYYLMFHCNSETVTGDVREVGGVFVKSAETAAGKDYIWRADRIYVILLIHDNNTATDVVLCDQIDHGHVFADLDVVPSLGFAQECLSDLFACDILVKKDSWL